MNSKSYIRKLVRESFLNEAPPGGIFGNFESLKKLDRNRNNNVSNGNLEGIRTWYEHPVFDKNNTLETSSENSFMKDGFQRVESIIMSSYFSSDKEGFSKTIKDLLKKYKSLIQKGIIELNGATGAISSSVIKDLRELSLRTERLLSKKAPSTITNSYVKGWLQLK